MKDGGIQNPSLDMRNLGVKDNAKIAPAGPSQSPYDGAPGLRPDGAFEDLDFYRLEFPFVEIMAFPPTAVTVVLPFVAAAAAPQDINVPSSAVICMMKGNANFWLSLKGTASIPVAPAVAFGEVVSMSLYNPVDRLFFCAGVKQLSVISPTDGAIVQAWFWPYVAGRGGIKNIHGNIQS